MNSFPGILSILFWIAYILNETVGAITGKFWEDGTAILWSALILAVWAVAIAVTRAAEKEKAVAQAKAKGEDERAAQYPFAKEG